MRKQIYLGLILLATVPAWPQAASDAPKNEAAAGSNVDANVQDRMLTPPPVSGEAYPVGLDSEEHSNYLHYGLTFSSSYSDNVLGTTGGHPASDISYSVWPTIGVDETTSRLHWGLTYAPGFTFYQRTSARNESDQNALLSFQYRLSPHVSFSAHDSLQRSSSVFNQPGLASGFVYGGAQGPNESVVAPIADRLNNFGDLAITYQYSGNNMVGAGGSFTNLHYPSAAQVPGLFDNSSQTGTAFYSHRLSQRHYVGVTYQYQRLVSYPGGLNNETQTHAAFFFYTVYPSPRLSISFFGGPQYADTAQPAVASLQIPEFFSRNWAPAGGASLNWQGRLTSVALSYSHSVSEGGGLFTAVRLDHASASIRQQFTRTLNGSVSGFYGNNILLGAAPFTNNGHTLAATAALERKVGQHLSLQLGYTRLHQTYNIPLIAGAPDTNREFISLSYDFARPLGR